MVLVLQECGVERLFYDPFSILDYIVFSGRMIDELERIWKDVVMAQLRHYSGICLEGLRKTTKISARRAGVLPEI
jgi:hypothetical protein